MLPGLNSNIKHEGRIFHIQTEDSGRKYAHVISHLFLDGVILASEKNEYKEWLTLPDEQLEAKLKDLLRRSHRVMIAKLTGGGFNLEAGLTPPPEPDLSAETTSEESDEEQTAVAAETEEADEEILIEETAIAAPILEKNTSALPDPTDIADRINRRIKDPSPLAENYSLRQQIQALLQTEK